MALLAGYGIVLLSYHIVLYYCIFILHKWCQYSNVPSVQSCGPKKDTPIPSHEDGNKPNLYFCFQRQENRQFIVSESVQPWYKSRICISQSAQVLIKWRANTLLYYCSDTFFAKMLWTGYWMLPLTNGFKGDPEEGVPFDAELRTETRAHGGVIMGVFTFFNGGLLLTA